MNAPDEPKPPEPTSKIQHAFRLLLGSILIFTGISHLTWAREEFKAQVPNSIPLPKRWVVVPSGYVEIVLGGSLIMFRRYRTALGWIVGAFFVAIFPGNIAQYLNRIDAFGLDTDRARAIRLLFQPVLVAWALWSTGAWTSAFDRE